MKLKSLKQLDVGGKTVLVRVDFNVPMEGAAVSDTTRIEAAVPTIDYLLARGARILLISHFGRPEGWDEHFSLAPVADALARVLGRKLAVISGGGKLPDYDIPHVYFFRQNFEEHDLGVLVQEMRPKDVALLENIRFYKGEKKNDSKFAEKIAALGDVYVNEAFSNSHRGDASMTGVPGLLPAAAGLTLERETFALSRVTSHPKKPMVIMMGGKKLSGKVGALVNLARDTEAVVLGGAIANLLLKARGYEIGRSVTEEGQDKLAQKILRDYKEKIKLPMDVVVSTSVDGRAEAVPVDKVRKHHMILDIGPKTILHYSGIIKKGKTLIWNGPMGLFERHQFSHGTFALGRLFATRSKTGVYGVAGGGETLDVIARLGLAEYIDHVSTGGGAMLDFLAGEKLPGLEALKE